LVTTRLPPHDKVIVRFDRAITCMNPTENPRDNVIVRTWVHYNIIARIFPTSDLTEYIGHSKLICPFHQIVILSLSCRQITVVRYFVY
jgi:hypothetical protein